MSKASVMAVLEFWSSNPANPDTRVAWAGKFHPNSVDAISKAEVEYIIGDLYDRSSTSAVALDLIAAQGPIQSKVLYYYGFQGH